MIRGVGIDIVSIARIAKAMEHNSFVRRILRDDELIASPTAEWVAGRWAAKEAIAKAYRDPLAWHDVFVSPMRKAPLEARILCSPSSLVHVSISHDDGFAAAIALIQ